MVAQVQQMMADKQPMDGNICSDVAIATINHLGHKDILSAVLLGVFIVDTTRAESSKVSPQHRLGVKYAAALSVDCVDMVGMFVR